MIINAQNYPNVFKAFLEIDLCNGAVNRLEPASTEYEVPPAYENHLDESEKGLSTLSEETLSSFCGDGDHDENQELLKIRPDLQTASALLDAYFNGWQD